MVGMTGIYSEHDRAATDDGDPHNDDDRDCKNAVGDDGVDEGDVGTRTAAVFALMVVGLLLKMPREDRHRNRRYDAAQCFFEWVLRV